MSGKLVVLALALLLAFRFWDPELSGNRAYRRGDYAQAVEYYREALSRRGPTPQLLYNLGTALLRSGSTELARERLATALEARSAELRAVAFYNLGNALAEQPGPGDAGIANLRAAISAYQRSLLLDPDQDDVRWNLELALRQLERFESERPALPGPETEDPERPEGEGRTPGARPRPGDALEGSTPQTGRFPETEEPLAAPDAPMSRELAEQILRAVEERERGLQREKLKQRRQRARGPDW